MKLLEKDCRALAEHRLHKELDAEIDRIAKRAKERFFAMQEPITQAMRSRVDAKLRALKQHAERTVTIDGVNKP